MPAQANVLDFPSRSEQELFAGGGYVRIVRREDSLLTNELHIAVWHRWIERAAHHDDFRVCFRSTELCLAEGQIAISVRDEAEKYRLSHKEIRALMEKLAAHGRISWEPIKGHTRGTQGAHKRSIGVLVTICNYAKYQRAKTSRGTQGAYEGQPKNPTEQHNSKNQEKEIRPDGGAKPDFTAGFDSWWQLWIIPGTKRGKGEAVRAYRTARKTTSGQTLDDALRRDIARWQRSGTDPQFIKHPASWLNGHHWEDDVPPPGQRRPYVDPVYTL
jgi:hypothetical protein